METSNNNFLQTLGIKPNNPGAYFGDGEWSTTTDMGEIECMNPATGEVIGTSKFEFEHMQHSEFERLCQENEIEAVNIIPEPLDVNCNMIGEPVDFEVVTKVKVESVAKKKSWLDLFKKK